MTGKSKSVIEIDHTELTIRLLEIAVGLKRPTGQSGLETLDHVRRMAEEGELPNHIVRDFEAMSVAAIEYLLECANKRHSVQ